MKKIYVVVLAFLFFVLGCDSMMNTPTKRVEEFLNKYQRQDDEVISQLRETTKETDFILDGDNYMEYTNIMKRQYKDLTYTIKEEMIDGENATVTVEIEVYDFKSAIKEAEEYYTTHSQEFKTDDKVDNNKYVAYKLNKMNDAKDRIKYTLNLTLSRKDKKWVMNNITDTDRQKIHGLYSN